MTFYHLFRFFTLFIFRPLIKIHHQENIEHVPILMYHSISERSDNCLHPLYPINTSPQVFKDQMDFLYRNHFTIISLDDVLEYLLRNACLPSKPVVLTFDDGYADFYINALPIISRYNFHATTFLPTDYIKKKRYHYNDHDYLSWQDIQACQDCGIQFGSHTMSHANLATLSKKRIIMEIGRSKEIIQEKTGAEIIAFSYPFAFPETRKNFITFLEEVLKQCGYQIATTTLIGRTSRADKPLYLKRIPINYRDDRHLFRAKLEGGYDWMHTLQYIKKKNQGYLSPAFIPSNLWHHRK
jgi:peptidoglycan/xylan/chitin deacetylase (PgdA/CDA1 family)